MNKIIKRIVDVIFIIIILMLGTYAILRFIDKLEIYKVETGSMEDGIHVGDYILISKRDNYKIGDVVTYRQNKYFVTHRIVEKNGDEIITKGDANNVEDSAITVKDIVGKVIYKGGLLNIVINYKYVIASFMLSFYLLTFYLDKKNSNKEDENVEENKDNKDKEEELKEAMI